MTRRIDTVIIGAGQAGLAMSRTLSQAGVEHVVLERGRIGERWRSERWPSLRLLTPSWMTRLPGIDEPPHDPHGFMPATAFAELLDRYALDGGAPVATQADVFSLAMAAGGFEIETSIGTWRARSVVIATGACDLPRVPAWARDLSADILQVTPNRYRSPEKLPDGGVLVVGASATGVQLAQEIRRAGRSVFISVGRHVRTPRRYRGGDIFAWLDASGFLRDLPHHADPARLRAQPSFQLIGDSDAPSPDLDRLAAAGIRIVGRASGAAGSTVIFEDDLPAQRAAAEARRRKVLSRIDSFIAAAGVAAPEDPEAWDQPAALPPAPTAVDLREAGVRTVLWATGYRRTYPWLQIPVLDADGEIAHQGGVTPVPGLFVLGMPFMRRRASALIDGVGRDAAALAPLITNHLEDCVRAAA